MKTTSSGVDRLFGNTFFVIGVTALILLAGLTALAWIHAVKPACTAEMGRDAKMECLREHGQ
jgi:hypothetical protein